MYTSSLILFPFSPPHSSALRRTLAASQTGPSLVSGDVASLTKLALSRARGAPLPAAAAHLILPPLHARCRIHIDTLRCLTDLPPSHPTARLFPLYLSRSIPFFFPSFDTIALHASFVLASAWTMLLQGRRARTIHDAPIPNAVQCRYGLIGGVERVEMQRQWVTKLVGCQWSCARAPVRVEEPERELAERCGWAAAAGSRSSSRPGFERVETKITRVC